MRRRSSVVRLFVLALAVLAFVRVSPADEATSYPLRGILRNFDPKTGEATISHEAVQGYMPAMTMDFTLADPAEMNALHLGETFTCRLRVARDRAWIEAIHKEDVAPTANIGPMNANRSTELNPGDALPDIELLGERGQAVRLSDFRGKALAISFIYLRCPLPTYCPLMNRNFQATQALLARLGLKDQTRFLSISMDAQNDTPERLAGFAEALEADEQVWTFAAARETALRALGDAVGLEFERKAGVINHNLRTVVVDPRGRIRRIFRGNTWTPQELAAELRAAASVR